MAQQARGPISVVVCSLHCVGLSACDEFARKGAELHAPGAFDTRRIAHIILVRTVARTAAVVPAVFPAQCGTPRLQTGTRKGQLYGSKKAWRGAQPSGHQNQWYHECWRCVRCLVVSLGGLGSKTGKVVVWCATTSCGNPRWRSHRSCRLLCQVVERSFAVDVLLPLRCVQPVSSSTAVESLPGTQGTPV